MSRYSHHHSTFDSNDCTATGWKIDSNKVRARFTRRNRWQGSRNGVQYVTDIEGPLSESQSLDYVAKLDTLIWEGLIEARVGSNYGGFRCIDAGHVVQ